MSITMNNKGKILFGLLVHDHPGVMMKITGMFARRGFNIASITVGASERPGLSRITIMAEGDEETMEQINKQLNKLVDVLKVKIFRQDSTVREMALVKVNVIKNRDRQEIITLIDIFRGKVIDVTTKTMTLEIVGTSKKVDSFIHLIDDIVQIREISRSGVIAMARGEESISLG